MSAARTLPIRRPMKGLGESDQCSGSGEAGRLSFYVLDVKRPGSFR